MNAPTKPRRILGCDPGVSGALALIDFDANSIEIHDMPITKIDGKSRINHHTLANLIFLLDADLAVVEHVSASPQMGVVSAFNFGQSFASIVQALASSQTPYELVAPNVWTRVMGVKAKENDSSRQRASMLMPQFSQHWPNKGHHGRSDAALLSLYARKYL